ncbi:MAG: HD domain-containing protein [Patescibacteria group bacterium]|nr:HD domain-containing protein [Patescibacteria group bacterium]
MKIKNIVNFIFEINQLKRQIHSGFQIVGIKYPDTVAEHALRSAQIGYILAIMEGNSNPEKVACMLIIHDNPETRIGDQHKVAARYFSNKKAEEEVFEDQIDLLGEKIKNKWKIYFSEYENRNTEEGIIAKDADWIETAFQAKEYVDLGYERAVDWIDNVEKAVETKSAKKIIKEIRKTKFTDWWKNLKRMTYKKLKK